MNILFENKSQNNYSAQVYFYSQKDEIKSDWIRENIENGKLLEQYHQGKYEAHILMDANGNDAKEELRNIGYQVYKSAEKHKIDQINIEHANHDQAIYVFEGIALSTYKFEKYKTEKGFQFKALSISTIDQMNFDHLIATVEGNHITRTLVNEHPAYLTPVKYSEEMKALSQKYGFSFDKLDKAQIESLKMGGLLAVNAASDDDPTFNIMEWKPENAKNAKPIVLVGKGVVYDTGGLSLKPTPMSMDFMKADMAGSGAVVGTMCAIAKANLNVHVIGLVAATYNKIGPDAYSPGDVITMHNGKTVEVLNTDAEGRLTMADALSYADKYDPEIVIDIATLTGAAARAIGTEGSVMMGTADESAKKAISNSGYVVHERLVEFPLWKEYDNQLKSDIADMKNLGGDMGGAITAGMFLKHFISYPWMHIDIAAPAYLHHEDKYRGKNGTGVGVRLFFDWLVNY